MNLDDLIARVLMRNVVRDVRPDRRAWAKAMSAEFEHLESGRLVWAIGCWSAVMRWNAGRDGLLLMFAVLAAVLLDRAGGPFFLLTVPKTLGSDLIYLTAFGPPALCAGLLAFAAPRHAGKFAIIMSLAPWISQSVSIYYAFGASPFDPGWKLMDSPNIVGYTAWFCACYLAADVGRRVGRMRDVEGAKVR